jgi:large conductance mechanosensitive channel
VCDVLKEFKQFLLRGNVVELAVAIVIGIAFGAVVSAFVKAFLTPLIGLATGKANLAALVFTVGSHPGAQFPYGLFLAAAIAFVLIATVVFFLVVKPINALVQRSRNNQPEDPTTKKCPQCLSEIPLAARRCAFCTSDQKAAA